MKGAAAISVTSPLSSARQEDGAAARSPGNPIIVIFGLAGLVFWITLYLFDPDMYLSAIRKWVPEAVLPPFIDTSFILGQLACWRRGINVYVTNPCDEFMRTMVYPPLWLRLWFLPSSPDAKVPFALCVDVGFILSLIVLPRIPKKSDLCVVLAALASSAIGYGFERGNVDLLIFSLVALIVLNSHRPRPERFAGYAMILVLTLLKIYPIVLFPLILRERRRTAAIIGMLALAVLAILLLMWYDQWLAMLAHIPGPEYSSDGPGGKKLAEGLFVLADGIARHSGGVSGSHLDGALPRRAWIAGLFALLTLPALLVGLRLARQAKFLAAMGRLGPREKSCLAVGGLLYCGCFVLGTSIAYREVFILFALPGLLRFRRDATLPRAVRWIAWMVVPVMWSSYPALMFDIAFGKLGSYGGPAPTFAFWALRECVWWWLFVILTATLFARASLSGVLDIHGKSR